MRGEYAKVALDNDELLSGSLDGALQAGFVECQNSFSAHIDPVGFEQLPSLLMKVLSKADALFMTASAIARDETSHNAFRAQLEVHDSSFWASCDLTLLLVKL